MSAPVAPEATLVLHLHPSRRKARAAAVAEVVALLRDVGGRPLAGGPLSELAGVAWVAVDERAVGELPGRLRAMGYTEAVELVRPADATTGDAAATARGSGDDAAGGPPFRRARWKGRDIVLVPLVRQPPESWREGAPDRRSFLLECGDGVVRRVAGYRGGRGPLEHRALPVADARLLVNLVAPPTQGWLLDPFAGAGGVVIEARAAGWTTCSLDADPALRYGLAELADAHVVGDARALPFAAASADAVATEPPYHRSVADLVALSVAEIARVLRPGGLAAVLAGADQAPSLRQAAAATGLRPELDAPVNRKGTPVVLLCWRR